MENWVGFRLCPTEDEMVGRLLYYKLMQRALKANTFINDINIYNYEPWELPLQSRVKSRDSFWYFYTPVGNNASGGGQNRSTNSGFWGITGNPSQVYDRWGFWSGNRGEIIGFKRVLTFQIGRTRKKGKKDWVIHEYHNTMLPQHLRTHVLCRMEYKGDDIRFLCDNIATEMRPALVQELISTNSAVSLVDQSVLSVSANQIQHVSGNLNTQEQVPVLALNENEIQTVWNYVDEEDFRSEFDESMEIFQA